jgi:hypothetical protein
MATIASLAVQLVANSDQLEKGLAGAMGKLKRFAGTAAALLGVGSIGSMLKGQIDLADSLAKTAQKTGLSVEALSQLKYAGDLADVSLDQLTTAAVRMNKSLGEGSNKTAEALAGLGMSLEDVLAMDPDQRFVAIAGALGQMEDETKQAAIGSELLGRSFAQLLPLFAGGADGVRQVGAEARAAGQVMSTEFAQNAERVNDALTRLGKVGGAVGNTLLSDFIGPLADGLERILPMVQQAVSWLSKATRTVGQQLGGVAAFGAQVAQGNFAGAAEVTRAASEDFRAIWGGGDDAAALAGKQDATNQILRGIDAHLTQGVPARAQ